MSVALGTPAAGADRLFRRAGAALGPAAELVFDEPVLQAVERDDAQPPARRKAAENGLEPLVEGVEFAVDCDAQRLETAAGRVFVFAALGRGHGGGNELRQLQRCLQRACSRARTIFPAICQA